MNTTRSLCFAISALSSYAALVYRLCQVRGSRRDSAYRTLVATLVLQCLTFTMGAVATGSKSFLGVGNLAILVMHVSAVAFCVSAQIILLRWASDAEVAARQSRYWLIGGSVVSVLLVALFFAADGPNRSADDFNGSSRPLLLTYLLVFVVSQAVPCVTIFRQVRAYAGVAGSPSLRQALRLLSVAAVLLFLYCTARTVNILTLACGIDIGVWQLAASVLSAVGIVVLSLSLTVSSWGTAAARLLEWARSYRAYRVLYPLWRDLYEASPDIALEPPRVRVSDLNYRLHRRVVEIRDGWRDLRPYIDRATNSAIDGATSGSSAANGDIDGTTNADAATNGGFDRTTTTGSATNADAATNADESRQAFAEAAQIHQALRAKRIGSIPDDNKDAADFEDRDTDNFTAEVAWLSKVAVAYRKLGSAS
ncbi:MAB_1171c family putative transporter [Kitasatospora acidiphila]|uniref:MAB_1171c family putative transporter n=1 Tax=Kitasatospora acidiphila TaxID=2567942 RepID=UPI003C77A1A5